MRGRISYRETQGPDWYRQRLRDRGVFFMEDADKRVVIVAPHGSHFWGGQVELTFPSLELAFDNSRTYEVREPIIEEEDIMARKKKEPADVVKEVAASFGDGNEAVIEKDLEKVLEQESAADAAEAEGETSKPAKEIDYGSPAQLAIYDARTVEMVNEKAVIVKELEAEWKTVHSAASDAKKEFETSEVNLRKLIDERKEQRGKAPPKVQTVIPFPDGDDEDNDPSNFTDDGSPLGQLYELYPITFERWGRWDLTEKDVERLNGGETKNHGTWPILTLGDVSKFVTPNAANPSYTRSLKDYKGLGDKGYDRWQEAELKFWKWWNDEGGANEFAKEKGVTNGNEGATEGGGEGPVDGDPSAVEGEPVATDHAANFSFAEAAEAIKGIEGVTDAHVGKPKRRKRKAA